MTNKDKIALADALRDQVEVILMGVEDKTGYYTDLEHLSIEEIEAQLWKWLDKLPDSKLNRDLSKPLV